MCADATDKTHPHNRVVCQNTLYAKTKCSRIQTFKKKNVCPHKYSRKRLPRCALNEPFMHRQANESTTVCGLVSNEDAADRR